ncbi:DUF418 domain-containing protein [Pseudopontixanthobacter vadosimaris]|uniref:DUF418 domain-containing protein n=1 Tax=Pseudopontixanthobacter vadosimaris TaxID=2726450 RepID=UPI001F0D9FE4|nr:DUF418 domain-containing protein [Pseudopontixanthobacter vadosimaris]
MVEAGSSDRDVDKSRAGVPGNIMQPMPLSRTGQPRIASLDFIRGIAVLGILLANIVAFGQPWVAYIWPPAFMVEHGPGSDYLWLAQFTLIDGKMRALFTLLFGAGMVLFVDRAKERGASRWLQARRLFFLLLFGLSHFLFIWRGDILTLYAIWGLVALLCIGWDAKTQVIVGLMGFLAGALIMTAMGASMYVMGGTEAGAGAALADGRAMMLASKASEIEESARDAAIVLDGSYGTYVEHNFSGHLGDIGSELWLTALETLPLILIGMGLYRLGLFTGGFDPVKQRRWGWAGLLGGGALTLAFGLWVKATGFGYFAAIFAYIGLSRWGQLPMALGMAALLALWAPTATGWLGRRLSAAGRMAFTNYIGTSVVMMPVFHGQLCDLFGRLDRAGLYVVVLLAWAIMLAGSEPWLARFRYGPLEWLWRCLTYGRVFALRRGPVNPGGRDGA